MMDMGCCHYYAPAEVGDHAKALGIERAALITDRRLSDSEHVAIVNAIRRRDKRAAVQALTANIQ